MRKYVEAIMLTTVVVLGSIMGGEALQQPYGDISRQDVTVDVEVEVIPDVIVNEAVEVIAENDVLEIGQMGRLEASGDSADWTCVPDSADGQAYGEGDLSYCISFRATGTYTVVAAILADGEVNVVKYVLQVEGPETIVVDPVDPVDPDGPHVDPINADPELVAKVQAAAVKSRANKTRTADVAEVFAQVAQELKDEKLSGSTDAINRTAVLNRELNVSGLGKLMGALNVIIMQADESGKLDDDAGCLEVWLSIAAGLNQYAS